MTQQVTLQVGTKAFLVNKDNEYLLLERSKRKYPDVTDVWDIPGGRITPGTPLLENLHREVAEETGLHIKGVPRLVTAQDILLTPGRHTVRLSYVAHVSGTVTIQTEEADDHQWVAWENMADIHDLDRFVKEVWENHPQPVHHLLQSQHATV